MLLVTAEGRRFVLSRDTPDDRQLLQRIDEILEWPADAVELFGLTGGTATVAGRERPVTPLRNALGAAAVDALAYRAYRLTDRLIAATPEGLVKDSLLSSYHEVAENWVQLLIVDTVCAGRPHSVAIVSSDIYEVCRDSHRQNERSLAHVVDEDWRERQKGVAARVKLALRKSWAWFYLRVKRQFLRLIGREDNAGGLAPRRASLPTRLVYKLRRYRYVFASKLIHWTGSVYLFLKVVAYHVLKPKRSNWAKLTGFLARTSRRQWLRARRGLWLRGQRGLRRIFYLPAAPIILAWVALLRLVDWLDGTTKKRRLEAAERAKSNAALARALAAIDAREFVIMTGADSGSRVNLDPMLAIDSELHRGGAATLVLTDSPLVASDAQARGANNIVYLGDLGRIVPVDVTSPRLGKVVTGKVVTGDAGTGDATGEVGPVLEVWLDGLLEHYWRKMITRQEQLNWLLDGIAARKRVRAVVSINEALPISVAAGQWAVHRAIPWIGHFPILVGRRPDGYFFPAPLHLAYGGQIRDHMIDAGKDPAAITVVGAHTYDKHRLRDRAQDRARVEVDFPRARGARLVTVGTEAFPDPETELGPILSQVPLIEGVHVIVKLHPADDLATIEAIARRAGTRDRVDIVKAYPIGPLLAASDLLLVVLSNIVIEAAVMGTPTLICDFSSKASVIDFVEQGLCLGCKDPADVAAMVRRLLYDPETASVARARMLQGVARFNGPNDGQSSRRIAAHVLWHAGLGGKPELARSAGPERLARDVGPPGAAGTQAQPLEQPMRIKG